jgi:hypothetical protein
LLNDVWFKMSSQNKALWIKLREEDAASANTSEKNGGKQGGYGRQYEQSANRSNNNTATTPEAEQVRSEGDTADDRAGNIWKVITAKKTQRNQNSMKTHRKKGEAATVAQNTLLMRDTRHI